MLKKYGVKTEAVITPNTSSWVHRYTTNCYLYEFQVGNKTYDGNSLVEEGDYRKIAPGYKCYTWIGILLSTDLRIIGMINHFLWIIRKAQINKRL